jgi:hypothetical protein
MAKTFHRAEETANASLSLEAWDAWHTPWVLGFGDTRRKRRDSPATRSRCMNLDSFIVTVATGAVAIVLLLGLANMLRGGSANRSQNLMRLRVVLQAVAIVLIVLVLWWRSH